MKYIIILLLFASCVSRKSLTNTSYHQAEYYFQKTSEAYNMAMIHYSIAVQLRDAGDTVNFEMVKHLYDSIATRHKIYKDSFQLCDKKWRKLSGIK